MLLCVHNANGGSDGGGLMVVVERGRVDFINVVHARRLKLSIIVVLASAWNIFKGGYYNITPTDI